MMSTGVWRLVIGVKTFHRLVRACILGAEGEDALLANSAKVLVQGWRFLLNLG